METARPDLRTLALVAFLCMFYGGRGRSSATRGREGGVVELDCGLPPPGPSGTGAASASRHVVEWDRRDATVSVLMKFGPYTPRVHPQYEGRVTLVRSTSLRMEGLRVEDEGEYRCRLLPLDQDTDQSRNSSWMQLTVSAPPTFTKTPPSAVEALVGSRLSLSCVANGNPDPSITWLKDGAELRDQDVEGGTLLLRAVTRELRGQYGCRASNPDGNITHVTTLQVKGPPVIIIPPESASLNMSQHALLRCQATADPPNMTYVWWKGQENVHHIESLKSRVKIMVDGTLLISRLTPEDSGKYTCMPSNDPAQALAMPGETYLPTGMRGVVTCPSSANPALLQVDWTKDGAPLDLSLYPGWTLTSDGSLSMATVNEDSAGVFTCTPSNSFGSMGSSGPTRVLLQDPPSFRSAPQHQYQQKVGGALLIPCQPEAGPDTRVTWRKVTMGNGSLLLQPLSKDHQGAWECSVANRAASVSARTRVLVLGTTPHTATSLSVVPGSKVADVSWEPGYDARGVKQMSPLNISSPHDDQKQQQQSHPDWFSVPVPPSSGPRHRVTGLSPATRYQFNVLAQNSLGVGLFSERVSVRTLDAPVPRRATLRPPGALSVNRTSGGVLLRWAPPPAHRPPVTALVLQGRSDRGEWLTLERDVEANASQLLVPGLLQPESVPQPLLAGILGGVVFMYPVPAIYKCPSMRTPGSSSPDSLISRGPDGRFAAPADGQSLSSTLDYEKVAPRRGGRSSRAATFQRSASLPSRGRGQGAPPPFVLSVDLPPCRPLSFAAGPERRSATLQGRYLCDRNSVAGGSDWRGSLRSSVASPPPPGEDGSPAHPAAKPPGLPSTTASTLRNGGADGALEVEDGEGRVPRQKSGARYAPCPPHWDGDTGSCDLSVTSTCDLAPRLKPFQALPHGGSFRGSEARRPVSSPEQQQPEVADIRSRDRLTLKHLSAERQSHGRGEAGPEDCDRSLRCHRVTSQRSDVSPEAGRRRDLSMPPSVRDHKYAEHFVVAVSGEPAPSKAQTAVTETPDACGEMSVDEPVLEIRPSEKSVSHLTITTSLRRQPKGYRGPGGLTALPGQSFQMARRASSSGPPGRHLWKTSSLGSDKYDYHHQRSLSLDYGKYQQAKFLTPDAWVDSLSQENCSMSPTRRPDLLLRGSQSTPVPQTPKPLAHPHLDLPSPPPGTPSLPDSSSSIRTPDGQPPSLRRTPGPAARSCDVPTREWTVLSPAALGWPAPGPWGSGPQADAAMESLRGSGSLRRDGGHGDGEREPGIPGPLARGIISPPPVSYDDKAGGDDEDEVDTTDQGRHGHEADEVRGYVAVQGPATRGSFSSYASSGRGSMETASGRLSICLSPTLSKSPDEIEEDAEDLGRHLDNTSRRRKASVDESYEWDEDAPPPGTRRVQFQDPCGSQELQRSPSRCSLVSVQAWTGRSCSPQVEVDTVLF
ncbi:hypothetical protein NHX12_028104 [Muraenolepis orangiensis]|uniref:Protein turtle homolog A-like n=1 Tax=Muraenolepis orangiensis TaxID=630683 RepID=A0A9Q0EHU6_9TELE|nr:hypothetical protein NHX12_028104 [Muraenolepis orangiensis]